jgi:hypothetical protein
MQKGYTRKMLKFCSFVCARKYLIRLTFPKYLRRV